MNTVPNGPTASFVVDRREGDMVVIVSDESGQAIDVDARRLPRGCRIEGAVLRVRVGVDGLPAWETAERDRAEERRRLAELAQRVKRLQRGDRGGDVIL